MHTLEELNILCAIDTLEPIAYAYLVPISVQYQHPVIFYHAYEKYGT